MTDIDKWKDPWYRKLPCKGKCLWEYILSICDNAGVWKPDIELASFFIGEHLDYEEALKLINEGKERVKVLENGDWLILDFISFQYKELSPASAPHKQVLELIKKHNLPIPKGRARVREGLGNLSPTLKDKDIDKETDKDKETEKSKETEKEIKNIFEFYKKVLQRPTYKLTKKRKEKISQRLKEPLIGSVEWANTRFLECLTALCQVSLSGFHQGENEAGKRYVELDEHIFRSEEQVEKRLNEAIETGNAEKIKDYLFKEGYV